MTDIGLDELTFGNGYLIDLGSTLELFGAETDEFLRGSNRWNQVANVWHRLSDEQRGTAWESIAQITPPHVQQAIEILVTADTLAFDGILREYSIKSRGLTLGDSWACQKGILVGAIIPSDTREQVRSHLIKFRSDLVSRFGDGYSGLFHAGDKRCHDHLFRSSSKSWFAESNEHPLRALYYLHLSEISKVHCFLSKSKRDYIEELLRIGTRARNVPDAHQQIKEAVLSELSNVDELLPPVTELVLAQALEKGQSPGDALVDVRNSKDARAYRMQLSKLRTGARVPTVGSRAEVEKYFAELRKLGADWTKDPYEKIRYDTTKVEKAVSVIPRIGPFLSQILPDRANQILGMRLTKPDLVHLFISRWFRRK